ncbi:MAG: hypothetical protein ACYTAF_14765, partial [Planctomycetota bacterium]
LLHAKEAAEVLPGIVKAFHKLKKQGADKAGAAVLAAILCADGRGVKFLLDHVEEADLKGSVLGMFRRQLEIICMKAKISLPPGDRATKEYWRGVYDKNKSKLPKQLK